MKPLTKLRKTVDAFWNSLTGLGSSSRDKRMGGAPLVYEMDEGTVTDMWRGSDTGAMCVEAMPFEMTRKGWRIQIAGDPELSEEVDNWLDDKGMWNQFYDALCHARAYGGAGLLLLVEDGLNPRAPLDPEKVTAFNGFNLFHRYELIPATYYGDPMQEKFGLPATYYLRPRTLNQLGAAGGALKQLSIEHEIHESRILKFDGMPVTRLQRVINHGWGDSVFTRVYEVLRDYELTWAGAGHILSDFAQGIYKIRGLNELIASGADDVVATRIQLIDKARSIAQAIVLDAGAEGEPAESFERQMASLQGLPESLQQFALRLASALRMPVTLLMGQSPAGLHATGEQDASWFYERVEAEQRRTLKPVIDLVMKIVFLMPDGPTKGKEPEKWKVVFNSLKQLNDMQEAERRLKLAQADNYWVSAQVLTPEEVAISRFGGNAFNSETTIDIKVREKIDAEERLKPEEPQPAGAIGGEGGNPKATDKNAAPPKKK
jgi:uncharacterized protein